jgi:membrane fusion protein (multidrug efflux system)
MPRPLTFTTLRAVGITSTVIILLGVFKFWQISQAIANSKNFAPPPDTVSTVVVKREVWQPTLKFIAILEAEKGALLRAEESGVVEEIYFESGGNVSAGSTLVTLSTSVEEADLASAKARLNLAESSLRRAKELRGSRVTAQSEFDQVQSEYNQAESLVRSLNAAIVRKSIKAPNFTGRAGIRRINVGDFLEQGAEVVPVYSIDELLLNFAVPQALLPMIKLGSEVEIQIEGFPEERVKATLTAIDPVIDEETRSLRIQGKFKNDGHRYLPGMFGEVSVESGASQNLLSIPSSAVKYAPYGNSVFVVQKTGDVNKVAETFIKLGAKLGDKVAVLEGLEEGAEVVSVGAFKLSQGATVNINNANTPTFSTTPTVKES